MGKNCDQDSSPINNPYASTSTTTTKDRSLKELHKLSHKITKIPFQFDHNLHQVTDISQITKIPLKKTSFDFDHHHKQLLDESQPSNLHQQHQPPVYNVSKSDFRDVVQKLTGSPAHAPPVQKHAPPVKPQSSRLQRIRPPPLEHVGKFPPATGANPSYWNLAANMLSGQRPLLSPLPPLPAVHATAESPISAYMRCMAAPEFAPPSPGAGFGCLPSPGPFGFPQLTPLSPTLPAASPRWKSG